MISEFTRKQHGSTGFTLVELLVVMAIIAILAAILFPALNAARLRSYDADCISNLRQIGTALYGYATDSGGYFPMPDTTAAPDCYANQSNVLFNALGEYIPADSDVWFCKRYAGVHKTASGAPDRQTYYYWAWNIPGSAIDIADESISSNSSWCSVGLTTNLPARVLMSDRFVAQSAGITVTDPARDATHNAEDRQYHAGTRLEATPDLPGTTVLLLGGSAMKVSPQDGVFN